MFDWPQGNDQKYLQPIQTRKLFCRYSKDKGYKWIQQYKNTIGWMVYHGIPTPLKHISWDDYGWLFSFLLKIKVMLQIPSHQRTIFSKGKWWSDLISPLDFLRRRPQGDSAYWSYWSDHIFVVLSRDLQILRDPKLSMVVGYIVPFYSPYPKKPPVSLEKILKPSSNDCYLAMENDHRNSGYTH